MGADPGHPLLAQALAAQGPGRAEAAFEVGLTAFLAYGRGLRGGAGADA